MQRTHLTANPTQQRARRWPLLAGVLVAALVAALLATAFTLGHGHREQTNITAPWPTATPDAPGPTTTPSVGRTGHPVLVLTAVDIAAIRSQLRAGAEPQASAWSYFVGADLATATAAAPDVYAGPFRGPDTDQARNAFASLGVDGSHARDMAIAYAVTADQRYAARVRQFLLAWAAGNTPTTIADYDSKDTGQLQAPGYFSFAYAYDLTYDSGQYSSADRAAIASWFQAAIAALQSCLRPTLTDYFLLHPDTTPPYAGTYEWDPSKRFSKYDALDVGADFPLLMQSASLALAAMIGATSTEQQIMNDPGNPLGIDPMLASALTPHNDGDGAGTDPVPQEKVYKSWSGRGGMFDYMTYNTRICSVLVDMAAHLGWSSAQVLAARAKLHASWSYLARFFGPHAQPDYNPTDKIALGACLPRFALAWHEFGDARFAQVLRSGPWQTYYETQLIGPVMVTHGLSPGA